MDAEVGARKIDSKASLVEATEIAFEEIRIQRPDSPPEALAVLEAGLTAIRAIRDNPAVFEDTKTLLGMQEIVFAITAAAGLVRGVVVHGTTVPDKSKLN